MLLTNKIFIYCFFLCVYTLTLTSNFSAPHDSIDYLNGFEQSEGLLHPHHLLYHVTTYSIFQVLKLILPFISNHYLIEIVNALWGAGAILIINLFLRTRFHIAPVTAFLGTCLPAFSFGIWFYSTNIEVYMPSLFFLLLILYKISAPTLSYKTFIIVIYLHVLAILFHQVNLIFTPVILWKLWQSRKQIPFVRSVAVYSFFGGGIVLLVYLLAGWILLNHNSTSDFISWIRGYSTQSAYWFPLSPQTAVNATVGFGHALIGAHFVFKVGFIENYINSKFFYHSLDDETFLVRDISSAQAFILLVLTSILLLFLLVSFIKTVLHFKTLYTTKKQIILPLLLTFFLYSIFFFFWMPENLEFWFLQLAIFWLIILAGITTTNRTLKVKSNIWIIAMAIMLTTVNYFGSIRWLQNINNDYFFAKIEKARMEAKSGDLIILKDAWIVRGYLQRYSAAPVILIPQPNNQLERAMADSSINSVLANKNKIFLYTDESFMHAVKNQPFIDSLLYANAGKIDTIETKLSSLKIIHR